MSHLFWSQIRNWLGMSLHKVNSFLTKTRKTSLCQRQGLRPFATQMADSPTSNLGAATKENLKNRLSRCNFQFTITSSEYQNTAPACFQGFPWCDASLRNEGCFFFGAGLPKLASEQADTGEETKGAARASQQEVLFVFVKGSCL